MDSGDVIVHTNESLNFLLCGSAPLIVNKRGIRKKVNVQSNPQNFIDMSAFPPEVTNYRRNKRAKSAIRSQRITDKSLMSTSRTVNETPENSKKYEKIKKEKTSIDRISVELQTYSDNKKRKNFQIHQDWEERYVQPFLNNLHNHLNGEHYEQFVNDKNLRTIQASSISEQIQHSRAQSQLQKSRTQSRLQSSRDPISPLDYSRRPKTSIDQPKPILRKEKKTFQRTDEYVNGIPQIRINTSPTISRNSKSIIRNQLSNRPPFTNTVGITSHSGTVGYSSLHDVDAEASLAIPYIKINTSNCNDRVHKFQKHEEQEIKLTKVILQDQLPKEESPKPKKERSAWNINELKVLSETRFYYPGQSTKGRRPYEEILQSTVDKQLNQF